MGCPDWNLGAVHAAYLTNHSKCSITGLMSALHLSSVTVFRPVSGSNGPGDTGPKTPVIDSVTLTIKQGERVGMLGRNGAGKTTLLRILAGIFTPSTGSVVVDSDTATILDAGFGIEPWLSGRENAVSRLVLNGVPLAQHAEILHDLEAFLDLGPYFNKPTRTYSTGMLTRLVFGLATVRKHSVLIVDEGFGTVDDQFQRSAWLRLNTIIGGETTVVMASHNLDQLREHCTRGIIISRGKIAVDTDINDAIESYLSRDL